MHGDGNGGNGNGPETERSVEVQARTAGDRAWQAWRAQLAEIRAGLDEWKIEWCDKRQARAAP